MTYGGDSLRGTVTAWIGSLQPAAVGLQTNLIRHQRGTKRGRGGMVVGRVRLARSSLARCCMRSLAESTQGVFDLFGPSQGGQGYVSKHLHGRGAEGEGFEAGAVDGGGRRSSQQRLDLRLEQRAERAVEGGPQDLQRVIEEPARVHTDGGQGAPRRVSLRRSGPLGLRHIDRRAAPSAAAGHSPYVAAMESTRPAPSMLCRPKAVSWSCASDAAVFLTGLLRGTAARTWRARTRCA